ncbi:hypothetical protein [Granulosicoccus antarcticus]|nr:hypothetical protein [Granulosicoccus antarcticus]
MARNMIGTITIAVASQPIPTYNTPDIIDASTDALSTNASLSPCIDAFS